MAYNSLKSDQFRERLSDANRSLLSRLKLLEVLGTSEEVIVYSYGTRGLDLAHQLRSKGVSCLIADRSEEALRRAAADGFETTKKLDLDLPLVVAAAQHQLEVLQSCKRQAFSLVEGLYAFDILNQREKARRFSEGLLDTANELHELYNQIDFDCRSEFLDVLLFRASLDVRHVGRSRKPLKDMWIPPGQVKFRSFFDVGAYDGATLKAMKEAYPDLVRTFSVEPNPGFRANIEATAAEMGIENETFIGAAWSHKTRLDVRVLANGMMVVTESAEGEVAADALDALANGERYDYLKFDVEGSEREALIGAKALISTAKCVTFAGYHFAKDIVELPKIARNLYSETERKQLRLAFHHYSECFDDSIFYVYRQNN